MHLHRPASMSTLLLLLVLCGCSQTPAGTATPPSADETTGSLYFTSPEASVPVISELMTKKDWAALTRYYALTPDDPARANYESGQAYGSSSSTDSPAAAALGPYRKPFVPGSKFVQSVPQGEDMVEVTVKLDIDQGGGMTQTMLGNFLLHKSAEGYQLVPAAPAESQADAPEATEALVLAYRPTLKEKVLALPAPDVASLPALLDALAQWKHKAQIAPLAPETAIDASGERHYSPADEELMISLIGDRIEYVLEHNTPRDTYGALSSAGKTEESVTYSKIIIRRAAVAGAGPVYFAESPVSTKIMLPKPDTGH